MAMAKKKARRTVQVRLKDEKARLDLEKTKLSRKRVKMELKLLSTHDAAKKNRLTSDWIAKKKSANEIIVSDIDTLNNRGRQSARDSWAVASGVGGYVRDVVGIGVTPISTARDPKTGEPFEEFNEAIDGYWNRWARRKELCDIEQQKNYRSIQALTVKDYVVVGESFCITSFVPRVNQVGLVLQMAESEQLDMSITKNPDNGNDIHAGVEVNPYGAPLAYWFATQSTYGYSSNSVRVEARRVLHFFDQDRVRQVRGITRLAPIMTKVRHLDAYEQYTMIKTRMEACHVAAIQRDIDSDSVLPGLAPYTAGGETGTDAYGSDELIMEPGAFLKLAPGEDIKFNNPQSPGSQFEPFERVIISQVGAGIGLDYDTISRDYSKGTYGTKRQAMLERYKVTDPIQMDLIDDTGRPIREAFKTYAVIQGLVEAPGFFDSPEMMEAYLEDEWCGPPKPWIDPLKEVTAATKAIEARLNTRTGLLNEKGTNVRAIFRQTRDEQKLAKQLDLYLPDAQEKSTTTPTEIKNDASIQEEENKVQDEEEK